AKLARVVVEFLTHLVEFAALLSEALQFLLAPIVEGHVARAGKTGVSCMASAAAAEDIVPGTADIAPEPVEPVAPDDVGEHGQTQRPKHHEADDHQRDGRRRP